MAHPLRSEAPHHHRPQTLVSPAFLASKFIAEQELSPLLEAAKSEGVAILWVPVKPSSFKLMPIAEYHAAHSPEKPLASLSPRVRDRVLVKICEAIRQEYQRQAIDSGAPPSLARLPMTPEQVAASYASPEPFVQFVLAPPAHEIPDSPAGPAPRACWVEALLLAAGRACFSVVRWQATG